METNTNAIRKTGVQGITDLQESTPVSPCDRPAGMETEKKDGVFQATKNAISVLEQAKKLPYCRKAIFVDESGMSLEKRVGLHGPEDMLASEYFKTKDMVDIDRAIERNPFFKFAQTMVLSVPDDCIPHDSGRVLRAACYAAKCWGELHVPTTEDYFDMEMDDEILDAEDDECLEEYEPCLDEKGSGNQENGSLYLGAPSGFEMFGGNDNCDFYRVVNFESNPEAGGNPYEALISAEVPGRIQIMTGFADGTDLALKMEAVKADHNNFKVVIVSEKLMSHPAVLDFISGWRNVTVRLEKGNETEELSMLRFLLSATDYCDTSDEVLQAAVSGMKKTYGTCFDTEHLLRHCYEAVTMADSEKSAALTSEMFIKEKKKHDVLDELNSMTGLQNVKRTVEDFAALVMEEQRNPKIRDSHRHMIFTGNPGSGKTTVARKLAELIAECGIGNGVFVEAERSSLIGKYIGQTAPLVKKNFEAARGGVLFVDEAGFFTEDVRDGFMGEAIKEFVRYMENCPDVTVIFAMYKKELNEFLKLDPGLSSRISRVIEFEDYTEDQLKEIVLKMLEDKGYCLTDADGADRILEYIKANRKDLDNGRGARLFTEAILQEHSLDLYRNPERVKSRHLKISNDDISRAEIRMKERVSAERIGKRSAGFTLSPCISERRVV
ncbi:MAG: AAA family ATPase [Lachnospiraceae bacterium]|nr:AAA family ATPase [Lachnospiraceae bacterium]